MPVSFWSNELTIQNSGFSPQFTNQSMSLLNDGRMVVVWRASGAAGDGDPTEFGLGIRARILNADGTLSGTEFTVNSTTLNGQDAASVTTLSDGRFVVTWHSNENGDGGSGGNLTIRARVFNADGTPSLYNGSTNDFVVNDQPRFNDVVPVVAAVPGGGFAIAWQSPTAAFGHHDISMRVFGNNGPAGLQQTITIGNAHSGSPSMTTLADGKFVVGWHHEMGGVDDMVARIFNADGTPAAQGGAQFTLSSPGSSTLGDQFQLDLATLSDGRFVAVWTTNTGSDGGLGDGNGPGIRARVFNSDGTADALVNGGADFLVNTTTLSEQTRPQVVGLNDGRFLISFSSKGDPSGNFENNVIARLFNANGTPDGDDFVIAEGGAAGGGNYNLPNALVRTLDGRVLSLYDNVRNNPEGVYGRLLEVRSQPLNFIGTAVGETVYGTSMFDVVRGNGGDDRLFGEGGTDTVVFSGNRANYDITRNQDGSYRVADLRGGAPDGVDTVSGFEVFQFADKSVAVQSLLAQPRTDIDKDADSDVVFRHSSGTVATWRMQNGQVSVEAGIGTLDPSWTAVDTGDLDGDGDADVLWRHSSGAVAEWLMQGGQISVATGIGVMDSGFTAAAVADITGDGDADIVWRRASDGFVAFWDMQGGEVVALRGVRGMDPSWSLVGSGDFNGDGTSDLLWRHTTGALATWQMQNGQLGLERGFLAIGPGWSPVETGDLNGDGTTDILWRHTSGAVASWQMEAGTGRVAVERGLGSMATGFSVEETGDYNGDGTSDILWRHTSGFIVDWQMQNGQLAIERGLGTFGAGWQVV